MTDTTYPVTLDGVELDSYCNTIDGQLHELLEPITSRTVTAEGPINHDRIDRPYHVIELDTSTIPSQSQREAFELMVKLMQWANSLAGTLRYDVGVAHEGCEYHDDWVTQTVTRCKEDLCR